MVTSYHSCLCDMATVSARSFPSIPHAESSEVVNSIGWTRHRVSNLSMQIILTYLDDTPSPTSLVMRKTCFGNFGNGIHPNGEDSQMSRVRRESEHVRTVSSLAFWCTVGIRASMWRLLLVVASAEIQLPVVDLVPWSRNGNPSSAFWENQWPMCSPQIFGFGPF